MRAVRLHEPGLAGLRIEAVDVPSLGAGEALVRVHAAAITRDELDWPTDRLPATPSYELSGVVVALAPDVTTPAVGDEVYALTPFDRDGGAAEYVAAPAAVLAAKPAALSHVESAALPLAGLSAWQGLFDHGRLGPGQRVVVTGATGGVGHLATQLARWRGAYVIGVASAARADALAASGVDETLVHVNGRLDGALEPVDLVFDTAGGELLRALPELVRRGGRLVSVAEEPPRADDAEVDARYFVVEPRREQLVELARLVDSGVLRPAIDSTFGLADARAAFERSMAPGTRGKIVIDVFAE